MRPRSDPADSPLNPKLPFDMTPRVDRAADDPQLLRFVASTADVKNARREEALTSAFGTRRDALRALAGRIKRHTLDHLDAYLERFVDKAEAAGAQVHFATDADDANAVCLAIAKANGCKLCVKSKSMVTEETRLVPALEAARIETIETDLGEFIVQLDHDAPSHIVTPMIHKDRTSVARAFVRELGAAYTEDPHELTMIARKHMRGKFRRADLGVSGANFLVADSGSLVLCTNEGNGCLSTAAPRVHIAVVGIEKLIPRTEDLSVFLKLLSRSSTGQPLTIYTSIITGPRRATEHDGPEQLHIVLVDNGRTEILREPTRDLLSCIRCGACLNTCPVFRHVGGGHAYGAVYSGPIGAAITPLFKGLHNYPDLPKASSLCGACHEVCPVDIDLPSQLIRLRRQMETRKILPLRERLIYRVWSAVLESPTAYRAACSLSRCFLRGIAGARRGGDGCDDRGWLSRMFGWVGGWTAQRDLPTPPSTSFREWWDARRKEDGS